MNDIDRDITRTGSGYHVYCPECGKMFDSIRFDAAYCSSTCRSRAHRRAASLEKLIKKAHASVDQLITRLPRRVPIDAKSKTQIELESLARKINAALASIESE